MFLKNHGKVDDARRYLEIPLKAPGVTEWVRAVSADVLRLHGGDVKAPAADFEQEE